MRRDATELDEVGEVVLGKMEAEEDELMALEEEPPPLVTDVEDTRTVLKGRKSVRNNPTICLFQLYS